MSNTESKKQYAVYKPYTCCNKCKSPYIYYDHINNKMKCITCCEDDITEDFEHLTEKIYDDILENINKSVHDDAIWVPVKDIESHKMSTIHPSFPYYLNGVMKTNSLFTAFLFKQPPKYADLDTIKYMEEVVTYLNTVTGDEKCDVSKLPDDFKLPIKIIDMELATVYVDDVTRLPVTLTVAIDTDTGEVGDTLFCSHPSINPDELDSNRKLCIDRVNLTKELYDSIIDYSVHESNEDNTESLRLFIPVEYIKDVLLDKTFLDWYKESVTIDVLLMNKFAKAYSLSPCFNTLSNVVHLPEFEDFEICGDNMRRHHIEASDAVDAIINVCENPTTSTINDLPSYAMVAIFVNRDMYSKIKKHILDNRKIVDSRIVKAIEEVE